MVVARASVVYRESPPRKWNALKLSGEYYTGECELQCSCRNNASTAVNSLSRIDANLRQPRLIG